MLEQKDKGRVGLIARGCESRAINRLIADNQLKREDVYLIGIPCTDALLEMAPSSSAATSASSAIQLSTMNWWENLPQNQKTIASLTCEILKL